MYLALVPGAAVLTSCLLWRLRPRAWPVLAVSVMIGSAYVTATLLIIADYDDADGFMDCWPYCSGVQDFVRFTFWFGGGALVLIAVGAMVAFVIAALRDGPRRTTGA